MAGYKQQFKVIYFRIYPIFFLCQNSKRSFWALCFLTNALSYFEVSLSRYRVIESCNFSDSNNVILNKSYITKIRKLWLMASFWKKVVYSLKSSNWRHVHSWYVNWANRVLHMFVVVLHLYFQSPQPIKRCQSWWYIGGPKGFSNLHTLPHTEDTPMCKATSIPAYIADTTRGNFSVQS